jgi:uncharacterized membrane protein YuzA (DUF378 family)
MLNDVLFQMLLQLLLSIIVMSDVLSCICYQIVNVMAVWELTYFFKCTFGSGCICHETITDLQGPCKAVLHVSLTLLGVHGMPRELPTQL